MQRIRPALHACLLALGAFAAAGTKTHAQAPELRLSLDDRSTAPSAATATAAALPTAPAAPVAPTGTPPAKKKPPPKAATKPATTAAAPQPARARDPRQNRRAYDDAIDKAAARAARLAEQRALDLGTTPLISSDAFDSPGVRSGSFLLRPAITTTLGYDTNPLRLQTNRVGSMFERVAPEFVARSDWSRHALDADIRGSYTHFSDISGNDRPELDAKLRSRIDIVDTTRAELEGHYRLTTLSAGDPAAPTSATRPPPVQTIGGTVGIVERFNRLEIALRGGFDRVTYDNAKLNNGSILDQSDRNYDEPSLRLRASYEITPGVRPFVEARVDTRRFDLSTDFNGYHRNSDGQQYKAGSSFELSRVLTGEASAGWIVRRYDDPRLPDISGLLVDGSLVWAASALTTVRLTATTTVDETVFGTTTGVFKRDVGVQVDHAFRRWLVGTARIGWGFDDYGQTGRRDDRFLLSGQLTYKITPEWWLTGEVRQDRRTSNQPGNDYVANAVLLGLRFQR